VADDIVERLLDCGCIVFSGVYVAESRHDCLRHRAADLIEAQQAEIERLRAALEVAANHMWMTGAPQTTIDAIRKAVRGG
jgi:hypothetical protein